jgi:hypothetical protein
VGEHPDRREGDKRGGVEDRGLPPEALASGGESAGMREVRGSVHPAVSTIPL